MWEVSDSNSQLEIKIMNRIIECDTLFLLVIVD